MKEKLKRITIKVPKNKVYFVNARETHFDVLSKLLFRLLKAVSGQNDTKSMDCLILKLR